MKKFSVLMVALIVALMLFVSCEQKIPERNATEDDFKVYTYYTGAFGYIVENCAKAETLPTGITGTIDIKAKNLSLTFTGYEQELGGVKFVLTGSAKASASGFSLNFGKGSSIDGVAHTMQAEVTSKDGKPVYDVIIDGSRIIGLDKLMNGSI